MQRQSWSQFVVIGALWFGAAIPIPVSGQEPPPSAVTDVAKTPPEQIIYVPFKNLRGIFEKQGSSVFLSYQEYLGLWEKAWGKALQDASIPPVPGIISSAKYVATVQQDVANVQATLTVQVLKPGWGEIPVKFGGAAIGKITSAPGKVILRGVGPGEYGLLFSEVGEHTVTLEMTARVLTAPEGRSLELLVPTVGLTSFELVVPDADQTIEVEPKLLQEAVKAEPKTTHIRANLGSTDKIAARWHPRVGNKPDMELLASATSATLVQVEDGLIHTDAFFNIDVLRGQVERLRLAVPKGHRVLDVVSAARVREWKVAEEAERQIVTVELVSRQGGKIPLEIHTERAVDAEPFDVAGLDGNTATGIHLLDVLRESGQIALRASADLTLSVTAQQGLSRIDEAEVDQRIKRPGAAFYKFYTPQVKLTAAVKPVEPRLLLDHLAVVTFTQDQLKLETILNYTVERTGVFELVLGLPDDFTVEKVQCDSMKQFDVSADRKTLRIALNERKLGAVGVVVIATKPRDASTDTADAPVPLLEPQGVEIENGRLRVRAPESLDVITDSEKIVGLQPDPQPADNTPGGQRLISAWTFNRRPVVLPARTVAKPTRLTAGIATTLDVKQGQVQVTTALNYLVEYAGLDTFRFSVPEAIADTVQIVNGDGASAPIKQKSRAAQAVDGWVTWTVVLQRDVVGNVPFKVTYDLPIPGDADGKAQTLTVPLIRIADPFEAAENDARRRSITVARIAGEATVKKDRVLSVAASATGGDVEPIDVRELTRLPQDGLVGFRYYKQPVDISLTVSKYEVQSVVETVVSRGLVEVVLDRSGGATVRARFLAKSSERQRLRLDLPKGAELLGVMVERKPVALEKNPDAKVSDYWEAYYVNVTRAKSSEEPFSLAVLYRLPLNPPPFRSNGGSAELRIPMLGGAGAEGTPAAVQQLRVGVWVPDEYALVGQPKHFVNDHPARIRPMWQRFSRTDLPELRQWIGDDGGGLFDFPLEGHAYAYNNLGGHDRIEVMWWHLPFYTWVVSGAIVLIAVVLRNTSWENKLTLILLGGFLAAVYALRDADIVAHGLGVASYGLIAGAALWLIQALFRRSDRGNPAAGSGPPPNPPAPVIPPPGVFDSVVLGMDKPNPAT